MKCILEAALQQQNVSKTNECQHTTRKATQWVQQQHGINSTCVSQFSAAYGKEDDNPPRASSTSQVKQESFQTWPRVESTALVSRFP